MPLVISAREEALSLAQTPLPLPEGITERLSSMVAVLPGQLFALGLKPDQPRGLQKVTRTE